MTRYQKFIMILGSVVLSVTAFFVVGLSGYSIDVVETAALPLAIPFMIVGPLGLVFPAGLFLLFNRYIVFGSTSISSRHFTLNKILIGVIAAFSLVHYFFGWAYRDVYVDAQTVVDWALLNGIMMLTTVTLYLVASRTRTIDWLLWTHFSLFLWVFTYAFPWLGESV